MKQIGEDVFIERYIFNWKGRIDNWMKDTRNGHLGGIDSITVALGICFIISCVIYVTGCFAY